MKKYSKETLVGIFVVIGLACIGYMTVKLGNVGFLGENTYSLFGKFNTVTGLREGNPVNMLGSGDRPGGKIYHGPGEPAGAGLIQDQ